MSAQNFQFELVSPEEKLISEPVAHAIIPGQEGEMGIGPDHASFVVALQPGVVQIFKTSLNDQPQRIFIAGGFADVTGSHVSVLAEQAINVNDLDQAHLEQQIQNLKEDLTMADEPADKQRIESQLEVAEKMLASLAV